MINTEKRKENSKIIDSWYSICKDNIDAMNILTYLKEIKGDEAFLDILWLGTLNISGVKITKLYIECCHSNIYKFINTLEVLKTQIYTEEEINNNLSSVKSIPFINFDILFEYQNKCNNSFNFQHKDWEEYCNKQHEYFLTEIKNKEETTKFKK